MNQTALILGVTISFMMLSLALCALPPLSEKQLNDQSTLVVTGTILSVETALFEKGPEQADFIYTFQLKIEQVHKGDTTKKGQTIQTSTSRPAKRPPGWVGPQGQNEIPVEATRVKCYLREDKDGTYVLLMPNGLQVISSSNK